MYKFVLALSVMLVSASASFAQTNDVIDCSGRPAPSSLLGDGFCDDATWGVDFRCETWSYDNGDCPSVGPFVEDCLGELVPSNWLGNGICDEGLLGVYFNCEEKGFDNGDCDNAQEEISCPQGSMADCNGVCYAHDVASPDDGVCHDGSTGPDFVCLEWGDDGGDCPSTCPPGEVPDCDGVCSSLDGLWNGTCDTGYYDGNCSLGDGLCSSGEHDGNFFCEMWLYDGGECWAPWYAPWN